jgi:hypothetical protein
MRETPMRQTLLCQTLLCLALTAAPLAAAEPLSPAEFEALATGKTLFFSWQGQPYGAEQYLPGRRVVWSFVGDECQTGRWYAEQGLICFVYDLNPDPQCWTFARSGATYSARALGADPADDLVVTGETREALACQGPQVGV